jgi:hypothetical protein
MCRWQGRSKSVAGSDDAWLEAPNDGLDVVNVQGWMSSMYRSGSANKSKEISRSCQYFTKRVVMEEMWGGCVGCLRLEDQLRLALCTVQSASADLTPAACLVSFSSASSSHHVRRTVEGLVSVLLRFPFSCLIDAPSLCAHTIKHRLVHPPRALPDVHHTSFSIFCLVPAQQSH